MNTILFTSFLFFSLHFVKYKTVLISHLGVKAAPINVLHVIGCDLLIMSDIHLTVQCALAFQGHMFVRCVLYIFSSFPAGLL